MRIVSLAPAVTEMLFAVGAGQDVVGVTEFCDWPPAARQLPRVGSYVKPNVERVVSLSPDVVIAVPAPGNRDDVQSLSDLGLRVVIVREGPAISDVLDSIRLVAAEAGRDGAGEALIATVRARLDELRGRLARAPRRRVLVVVGRNPLVVAGRDTLIDESLRAAGGENVAGDLAGWPRLSVEAMIRRAPEVILDGSVTHEGGAEPAFYRDLGLAAGRNGGVRALRLDEVLRPGPRLAEGVEKLARAIHPEAFR
jgi:iron complex transport system substrate-binding protein